MLFIDKTHLRTKAYVLEVFPWTEKIKQKYQKIIEDLKKIIQVFV